MTSPAQSTIPAGGALDSAQTGSATPGGGTVASGTWLPPFKVGQGLTGVFVDARGLIAGEAATATGQAATTPDTNSGDPTTSGSTSAPAAGTIPSGGGNLPNGQPAPAATSQAQRQANLNNAYPNGGNPDPNVP